MKTKCVRAIASISPRDAVRTTAKATDQSWLIGVIG
jgi:hypothetical protein